MRSTRLPVKRGLVVTHPEFGGPPATESPAPRPRSPEPEQAEIDKERRELLKTLKDAREEFDLIVYDKKMRELQAKAAAVGCHADNDDTYARGQRRLAEARVEAYHQAQLEKIIHSLVTKGWRYREEEDPAHLAELRHAKERGELARDGEDGPPRKPPSTTEGPRRRRGLQNVKLKKYSKKKDAVSRRRRRHAQAARKAAAQAAAQR